MIYLGIDFGTSNSSIVFFDDESKMLEVIDPEIDRMPGSRVYPSVVAFDKEGNMMAAGWFALFHGHASPNLVVDQVKRWIGKPYVDIVTDPRLRNLGYKIIEKDGKVVVVIRKRTYTAEEMVTYILKHLIEEGRGFLKNRGIDIKNKDVTVIVAHPAYYQQNQVEAIREAVNKLKEQYLFCWDEVPGTDGAKFIEFLKENYDVDWARTENIEKTDDGKVINVSSENNSFSLRLNNEKTKAILTIDDERTDRLTAKIDNGRLNIYKKSITNIKIENVKVIPEPAASVCAALYGGKLSKNDRYVIVIDEGAGTLDTMLVDMQQINLGKHDELEARGITIGGHAMLGGSNMDNEIVKWVLDELRKDENINRNEINNICIQELRTEAENAKIDISEGRTKVAKIKVPGFSTNIELTESQLNTLVSPVIMDCKNTILESLNEIEKKYDEKIKRNIQRGDITKVILVGGPTKMKNFRSMINEILKAEIVDINPMECVAIGAAASPAVHYKVPADRTYGLLKKEDNIETFIEVVPKDTPLPKSVVLPWKVEAFEGKIPIEVAQVLEKDNMEMVCMKMGKYEFAASPVEKTYSIVFKLDEERKVEVIITSFKNRAEDYSRGVIKDIQRGDFRLEFIRDMVPSVIRTTSNDIEQNPMWEIFFKNAPVLYTKLKAADKIVKDSNRIIEFGIEDSLLKNLLQEKTEVENLLNKIMQDIKSGFELIEKGETINKETERWINQLIDDMVRSDDYLKLSIKVDALERRVDEFKDYMKYDKNKIASLINTISNRKTDAYVKLQELKSVLAENVIKEIESLLEEIERIQRFLENKNEILANSVDGEMYRDGLRKEQMLKSIIDQRLVQDQQGG